MPQAPLVLISVFLFTLVFGSAESVFAQSQAPSVGGQPFGRMALNVEAGGRAFWYNLGLEARFPVQDQVTVIAQAGFGIAEEQALFPISAGAFIGPGPHYAEVTFGITPLAGTGLSSGNVTIPIYDLERMLTHLSLGYRWNAVRRNFMLRAGYNPLFGKYQGRKFLWLSERTVQHWFYMGVVFDIQNREGKSQPSYRPSLEGG
ncbi:MAG: hypothetical protein AAFV07_07785 [Bacteroidota bacterium]